MLRAMNDKIHMKLRVLTMVSFVLFGDAVIGDMMLFQAATNDSIVEQHQPQQTQQNQQVAAMAAAAAAAAAATAAATEQQSQQIILTENLFDQLNAFIQSRAKNVSEISENVYFKYYNR